MIPTSKFCWSATQILHDFRRGITRSSVIPNAVAVLKLDSNFNLDLNRSNVRVKPKSTKLANQSNIRTFSTNEMRKDDPAKYIPVLSAFSHKDRQEFDAVLPDLIEDMSDSRPYPELPDVTKRFKGVLEYNAPLTRRIRGLSTVAAYKLLEKKDNLTPENIRVANILGWCVELQECFFNILDDILDRSVTRQNQPSWYTLKDVGLQAVNDAVLLENKIYYILQKYFSDRRCYLPLVESFHDVTAKVYIGQTYDNMFVKNGKPCFEMYTMENYEALLIYLSGYICFQFPMAVAMILAEVDSEDHEGVRTIVKGIGKLFEMQDDFLDCWGESTEVGTDIAVGRCTWFIVTALQRATPAQKQILEEHFGNPDPSSVQKIKTLYEAMNLPSLFATEETRIYNAIDTQCREFANGSYYDLLQSMLTPYKLLM